MIISSDTKTSVPLQFHKLRWLSPRPTRAGSRPIVWGIPWVRGLLCCPGPEVGAAGVADRDTDAALQQLAPPFSISLTINYRMSVTYERCSKLLYDRVI